ncbi:hypothetical protein QA641_00330 [Bradyrhizobium sp. CB1650]|uniref:hypothetical protein n=1 Tax=Bradyrhizobium sp. CB1650 TaxID=3039153 RepID=UPI002434B714|nr:hypothetical protein [Bradyrhizobium sp. CB1650]WGD52438.1 hypothetical protein QA641_00330 [Bradyrhizobium sp. CB1650]
MTTEANANLDWSHRDRPVPVDLRMRVLRIPIDHRPLLLGRLLDAIRSDRDPIAGVLTMACSDLLGIDLTCGPLGPLSL